MKQTFTVQMDDGASYRIESDARDIRRWESEYGESFLSKRFSFTTIAQLAYFAGKRTGVLNGAYQSYEDFDAHCVDASGVKEAPLLANPTQQAPTEGSSASSHTGSRRSRQK